MKSIIATLAGLVAIVTAAVLVSQGLDELSDRLSDLEVELSELRSTKQEPVVAATPVEVAEALMASKGFVESTRGPMGPPGKPGANLTAENIEHLLAEIEVLKTGQLGQGSVSKQALEDLQSRLLKVELLIRELPKGANAGRATQNNLPKFSSGNSVHVQGFDFEVIEFVLLKLKTVKVTMQVINQTKDQQFLALRTGSPGGAIKYFSGMTDNLGNEYRLIGMIGIGGDGRARRIPTLLDIGKSQTYTLTFRDKDQSGESGTKFSFTSDISILRKNDQGVARRNENGYMFVDSQLNVLIRNISP